MTKPLDFAGITKIVVLTTLSSGGAAECHGSKYADHFNVEAK